MISRYDMKMFYKQNSDKLDHRIDENNNIVHKETGEILCTLDDFEDHVRRKLHCDFEVIHYGNFVTPLVLRCRECGTVIFSMCYEDEDYDPNLCCPTCSDYKTHFTYYTQNEIDTDTRKQEEVKFWKDVQAEEEASAKRYNKRKKYDHQIAIWRIKLGKKYCIKFDLECNNLFKTKLQGLRLDVHWLVRDSELSYVYKKHITIPLSLYAIKIQICARRMRNENLG